jgi:hypothetical protein
MEEDIAKEKGFIRNVENLVSATKNSSDSVVAGGAIVDSTAGIGKAVRVFKSLVSDLGFSNPFSQDPKLTSNPAFAKDNNSLVDANSDFIDEIASGGNGSKRNVHVAKMLRNHKNVSTAKLAVALGMAKKLGLGSGRELSDKDVKLVQGLLDGFESQADLVDYLSSWYAESKVDLLGVETTKGSHTKSKNAYDSVARTFRQEYIALYKQQFIEKYGKGNTAKYTIEAEEVAAPAKVDDDLKSSGTGF